MAKYPKINYTGISGNNIAKFIYYQILVNKLLFKLKHNENIIVIYPIDILLMLMKSAIFVWNLGPYRNLNTTYVVATVGRREASVGK